MKKAIIIIMILTLISICAGCEVVENYGEKIKEDITEKLLENLLGDNAEVDITYPSASNSITPEASPGPSDELNTNNILWIDDIPSTVPVANLQIINTMKTPNGIILDFGEVDVLVVQEYMNELISLQFETIREDTSDKLIDSTYRKDETVVKVYWYINGSFTLMITWE